jgi:hypothetical protein
MTDLQVLLAIISLLGGGCLFFLARLVDRFEKSSDAHLIQGERLEATLKTVESLAQTLKEHASEIRRIDMQLAILQKQSDNRASNP